MSRHAVLLSMCLLVITGGGGVSNAQSTSPGSRLVSLSIPNDLITGEADKKQDKSVASVALDAPATTDVVVSLRATASEFTLPSSVTIRAGQTGASFEVTSVRNSVKSAQVVASANGWVQSARIACAPSLGALRITGLTATPAKNCVILKWDAPNDVLYKACSYSVRRRPAGSSQWVQIGSSIKDNICVDSSATLNTQYDYQVSLQPHWNGGGGLVSKAILVLNPNII